MSRIGVLAIMQDEAHRVDAWVDSLWRFGDGRFDRLLVVDGGSVDGTAEKLERRGVVVDYHPFAGDFAAQRNRGLDLLDVDWVFELDADEAASAPLLVGLRAVVSDLERDGVDCAGMARLTQIDGRLTPAAAGGGLDYQYRIHRRSCRWEGRVHEEVVGWRARVELSLLDGHFILHSKEEARHLERNAMYRRIA